MFQAKKRKLGLVDVDDEDNKTEEQGYGEGNSKDDPARVVNVRGECYCALIWISSPCGYVISIRLNVYWCLLFGR